MIYQELDSIDQAEFDAVMETGSSEKQRLAVFRAADCSDDYDWLIGRLRQVLMTSADPIVLSAAILGVGYVARRFRQGDERELKKMLRPFEKTSRPVLEDELEQAKWDIYVYLSKERRKRKRERRRALQSKL